MTRTGLLVFGFLLQSITAFASIRTVEFTHLSDQDISPKAKTALRLNDNLEWEHFETAHFVYHFTHHRRSDAETVYSKAEEYYNGIKDLFEIHDDHWKKKGHIFIFTRKQDWLEFNERIHNTLIPQAFTDGWELYIYTSDEKMISLKTLAHELTHLILFRYLDGELPLYLNEGFAEFVSYAEVLKQYGYKNTQVPIIQKIPAERLFPLGQFTEMKEYPESKMSVFYQQSESFARYLIVKYGGPKFYQFIRETAQGKSFRFLLKKIYALDYNEFDQRFRQYLTTGQ